VSEPESRPSRSSRSSGSSRASGSRSRTGSGGSDDAPSSSKGERRKRVRKVRRERKPTFWESRKNALSTLFMIVGAVLAAISTYLLVVYPAGKGPGKGRDVEITFERDDGTGVVVDKLAAAGLLASPRVFAVYARLVRLHPPPGRHLLTDDAGPADIVERLERAGSAARAKITIPEGWTRFDIARRLQAQHVCSQAGFLEATADPPLLRELHLEGDSAEGFLFPATYELAKDSDAREVVRRLVAEFERRFTLLDQNHRLGHAQLEASLGWSKREIVTLASLVEKEAAVDEERPIIASVFLNRLRDPSFKRKLLQCDPTAGYGCLVLRDRVAACAGYAGKITHAINMDPLNTYSTYVHEGLPPGPIANPGLKSLEAVLAPAATKYLYFVARGEGHRHVFSETLEEHGAAVKDLKERTSAHP
jgi:UPF0755 protein